MAHTHLPCTMPAQHVIDADRLAELREILKDEYPNFLNQLLADCKARIAEIQSAVPGDDLERLQRECHTLKGNAAIIGADALSEAARHLEKLAKAARLDEVRSSIEELETLYEAVHATIESLLPSR